MNKDIIYIDVEDDVTSVIGKVRASKEKIVALVPPKNIGSLQSAVNLRLLNRAADNAGKRLVLITNNSGLTALAAGVKIPVAKNLQSKPEIPEVAPTPVDADEDVIKGDELPVGELAAATTANEATEPAAGPGTTATGAPKPSDDDITITELPDLDKEAPVAAAAAIGSAKKAKAAHGSLNKVPNFSRFRKWIFIGGGLVVAIILFFVLGNVFFTNAKVVITAQTSDQRVNLSETLTTTGLTDTDTSTLKVVSKQVKSTQSVNFNATGTKTTGNKATGTLSLSNCISRSSITFDAGTTATANGEEYTFDKSVTVPGGTSSSAFGSCDSPGKATVSITAVDIGASYNQSATTYSVEGSNVSASGSATTGGSSQNITVVSATDIATATGQLAGGNAESAKTQLTKDFGDGYVVIGTSFYESDGAVTSSPAQDQQATTAKLSRESTYTMYAIPKDQIKLVTTAYLNSQIGGDNQKIYDDGSQTATVSSFTTSPSGVMTANIVATGKVGPNIQDADVKSFSANKKVQEIKQQYESVSGVKGVTVSISPFWRSTAPSADKISVSFNIAGNE